MRYSRHRRAWLIRRLPLLALVVLAAGLAANPQQLRMTGTLVRVDVSDSEKVLLQLQTREGLLEIPVTDAAAVRGADGAALDLLTLDIGQEVELRAGIAAEGFVVDEVRVLYTDARETLRSGRISDLQQSGGMCSFRLEELDVYANAWLTSLDRQALGTGLSRLENGQRVSVRGLLLEGGLAAQSIRSLGPGGRDARLELQGTLGVSENGGLEVALQGAARPIAVEAAEGGAAGIGSAGAFRLTGNLGPDGQLRVVEAASLGPSRSRGRVQLQLSPPLLRLKAGETAELELRLKPAQPEPVEIKIHSTSADIIAVNGQADFTIKLPAEGSTKFTMKAGTKSGQALITAAPASSSLSATPAATMAVVEAPEPTPATEAAFRPDHVKLRVGEQAELLLFVTPPPSAAIAFKLACTGALVCSVESPVKLDKGQAYVRVKVTGKGPGSTILRAEQDGSTAAPSLTATRLSAEAEVEVVGDTKPERPELSCNPEHLTIKITDTQGADLELVLTPAPAAGQKVEITLSVDPKEKVLKVSPEKVTFDSLTRSAKIHLVPATSKASKAMVFARAANLVAKAEVEIVDGKPK